jgi:hypothetical protein
MNTLKSLWQLAPTLLRSLLIAILVVVMAGVSTATLGAQRGVSQSTDTADSPLIARALPGLYSIPSSCSVPLIPSILTEEEIQLRQFQADFAKYIQEQAKLDQAANLTSQQDVWAIEKFQLDCEIMVIRAQQILRAGVPQPTPEELTVTPKEIELRKRQLAIAKEIDDYEITAHEAGIATLNRVWSARRGRIDAEILLLQSTVKQRIRNEQRN